MKVLNILNKLLKCKHPFEDIIVHKPSIIVNVQNNYEHVIHNYICVRCGEHLDVKYSHIGASKHFHINNEGEKLELIKADELIVSLSNDNRVKLLELIKSEWSSLSESQICDALEDSIHKQYEFLSSYVNRHIKGDKS